jgi:arylsulfatase
MATTAKGAPGRPNIVLILVDDMGYSDLGCYGGEIATPNIDALGRKGVRFSQFYNTARCSPSRASLLTGLHPHQTGIGILTNNDAPSGYPGNLNMRCVTIAEILRDVGYATCLSGKWHLATEMHAPNDAWPTRRGFERFFGTLTGCGSFYTPGTLTRGESDASAESQSPGFFYTDSIAAEAAHFIRDASRPVDQPFFLYTAFTAPHWPLHAPKEDVAKYEGVFDEGWDSLRTKRHQRLVEEGVLAPNTSLSDRDPTQPAWNDATDPTWQANRMQAYAAQIERMDRGVGQIVDALKATGHFDNTFMVFLSDNGASPEALPLVKLTEFTKRSDILPRATRDGRPIRVGNTPDIVPGDEDTYASYGRAWANLSNTPFRFYKRWVHEGGISTPLIVHWPAAGFAGGAMVHAPFQLVDVMPTIIEAAGAQYPPKSRGSVCALEGRSMLPALRNEELAVAPLYWEHTGNAAIRVGNWKLVREYPGGWELYDMVTDRAEMHDLGSERPDIVAELGALWEKWAERVGVIPFEVTLRLYRERGLTDTEAAG